MNKRIESDVELTCRKIESMLVKMSKAIRDIERVDSEACNALKEQRKKLKLVYSKLKFRKSRISRPTLKDILFAQKNICN